MAQTVKVTYGEVLIQPIQFNHFKVGPFEMTTAVKDDETPEQAMARAYDALERYARSTYASKLADFKEAYGASAAAVRGR
jgi:hypothetical protein